MTQMIEVKTAELAGPALDWAVATAEGMTPSTYFYRHGGYWVVPIARGGYNPGGKSVYWFSPSTDWPQGGPLIEAYKLDLGAPLENRNGPWNAATEWGHPQGYKGETPLIAACRSIVAAKLGDVVSVPTELV